MKKRLIFSAISMLIIISVLFSACGAGNKAEELTNPHETDTSFKVAVVQYSDSYAFSEMRQAFIARMRTLGYDEAKMKFDIKNAQGSDERLNEIAASLVGSDYDLIVPIASKASSAVCVTGNTIPSVFIGVSDPVGEGLASSLAAPDKNMTGTVYNTSAGELMEFMRIIVPSVRNVGIIYTKSTASVGNEVALAEKDITESGLTYEELVLESSEGVTASIADLLSRVDCVYIPADAILDSVVGDIVSAALAQNKFVFGSSVSAVNAGALAAMCPSSTELARASALLADKILQGNSVNSLAVNDKVAAQKFVSKSTVSKYSIDLPTSDTITQM